MSNVEALLGLNSEDVSRSCRITSENMKEIVWTGAAGHRPLNRSQEEFCIFVFSTKSNATSSIFNVKSQSICPLF